MYSRWVKFVQKFIIFYNFISKKAQMLSRPIKQVPLTIQTRYLKKQPKDCPPVFVQDIPMWKMYLWRNEIGEMIDQQVSGHFPVSNFFERSWLQRKIGIQVAHDSMQKKYSIIYLSAKLCTIFTAHNCRCWEVYHLPHWWKLGNDVLWVAAIWKNDWYYHQLIGL